MDFTCASITQNLIGAYFSHLNLHALTEVILEFYEWNINSLSKDVKKVKK